MSDTAAPAGSRSRSAAGVIVSEIGVPVAAQREATRAVRSISAGKNKASKAHHVSVGNYQAQQLEQPRCICTGGHLTEPYEQNTQQSPDFGRSTALQRSHS
jgi:hypothetical protein